MLAALLLLQEVAGPPAPRAPPPSLSVAPACPPDDGSDDVVVCGRRSDPPRLTKLPAADASHGSPADMLAFRLPGHATGRVQAFSHELPGATATGAAVSIRVPFGKGRKE